MNIVIKYKKNMEVIFIISWGDNFYLYVYDIFLLIIKDYCDGIVVYLFYMVDYCDVFILWLGVGNMWFVLFVL